MLAPLKANFLRLCAAGLALCSATLIFTSTTAAREPDQTRDRSCRIEAVDYKGWHAKQVFNLWVKLIVVPQNGGRLMQVVFADHPYLFVNPQYAGKYLPPAPGKWFNYGGDKLWPLPEGNDDEQHWAGGSDLLDDGPYSFQILSQGAHCEISLSGPADPQTGLQFMRTISLEADSPRISFHATMKNTTGHTIEWSVQSVSQYDTADLSDPSRYNHEFMAFAPANPASSYLNRYHVRFGPAENRSVSVRKDGLFALHYVYMAAELWLDSPAGWLAVVDGASNYAMIERFRYEETRQYPGKASVIFWTNGPELRLDAKGMPFLSSEGTGPGPYYLEAEINSPLVRLSPGETYRLDTEWFPARAGRELSGVTEAGVILRSLRATRLSEGKIQLSGSFGTFFPGRLIARFYDNHGLALGNVSLIDTDPREIVSLENAVTIAGNPARVSVHLEDLNGLDRGSLGETPIETGEK